MSDHAQKFERPQQSQGARATATRRQLRARSGMAVESADKNLENGLSKNLARLIGTVREQPITKGLDSGILMTTIIRALMLRQQERYRRLYQETRTKQ